GAPTVASTDGQTTPPIVASGGTTPVGDVTQGTGHASVPVPPGPQEIKAAWREGKALFDSGDYAGASSRLRAAADGQPDKPYVHYLFGLSLWKSGQTEEAEKALTRASELDKGSVKTW